MVSDKSKICFIYNPYSAGVLKRGSFLKKNHQKLNGQLHSLEKFSDVKVIVCKALKNKASHICIEGGDGTVHGVMTEFLKQSPNLTLPSFMLDTWWKYKPNIKKYWYQIDLNKSFRKVF